MMMTVPNLEDLSISVASYSLHNLAITLLRLIKLDLLCLFLQAMHYVGQVHTSKKIVCLHNFDLFTEEFAKVFDDPQRAQTANDAIRALKQGDSSVTMYASKFRRLIMDLDWNEAACVSQFSEGLNESVLDTLALFQTPTDLEDTSMPLLQLMRDSLD
ncbi:Retrotransposon-derived protein PEG10, partial [Zancudomyces culisetae]